MVSKAAAFLAKIRAGVGQFGLNCAIPSPHTTEILAWSGFDFFVLDAEHPPTAPSIVHTQVMALGGSSGSVFVKLPRVDGVVIGQYLDLGVDGVMAASIDSAADAAELVRATRYPPNGSRGVAGAVRATRYTRDRSYLASAQDRHCVIALIETPGGLDDVAAITATSGVDVVFFGPADLAAHMGFPGQPSHPSVRAALLEGLSRVRAAGKPTGIACGEADVEAYSRAGAAMFVVGSDVSLLAQAADSLAQRLAAARTAAL